MPKLKEELLTGNKLGDMPYKVHLDGYNQLDYWTGRAEKSARREFFYYDEIDLMAIRVDGWTMHIRQANRQRTDGSTDLTKSRNRGMIRTT